MSKHTYHPDTKSAIERVVGRLSGRPAQVGTPFNIGSGTETFPSFRDRAPAVLTTSDLAAAVDGTLEGYGFRFDPVDGAPDLYRPILISGDEEVVMDVFLRRRVVPGEA